MIEPLELSIDELLLDLENPRTGQTASQSEALASIVRLNPGHFRNLMASIRDEGLDPGDSLYVVRSEGGRDFVVLEGNRRLSALKVLSNPDILAGTDLPEVTRKPLVREASGFKRSDVEPIRCMRFGDRQEANDWIRRRHTGWVRGEGRITWNPLEIQRFSNDYTTIDVIEFVGRNANYSTAEWEKVQSVLSSGKSTNLTRLLESAAGQSHLGIKVQNEPSRKTPLLGTEAKWALRVLKRIVDDIVKGNVNSRSLNTTDHIEKYFANLSPDLQPGPNTTSASPTAFKDVDLSANKARPAKPTRPVETRPVPRTRRALAPKKHPFETSKSEKLRMLLREAGTLDTSRFPLSCAFLLRAIVELAVNDYLQNAGLPRGDKGTGKEFELAKKANDVLKDIILKDPASSSDLRAFRRRLLDKRSACSIQALNGFVHNPYELPTADALRAGWESVIPVLTATYGKA